MDRKLKDFLRKVSSRKKTEQEQNAEISTSSTRRERNSLPLRAQRPLSTQIPQLKVSPAEQNHDTSSPTVRLISEPLQPPVEQTRQPLAQSYENPPQRKSLQEVRKRDPGLPSHSARTQPEPKAPAIPAEPMSNSSNLATNAQTGSRAANKDPYDSRNMLADSVAHDYAAYQPMLASSPVADESQYTSIARDNWPITDAGHSKHNEGIASRNILADRNGHHSSPGNMPDMDLNSNRNTARHESTGRKSVGSSGTSSVGRSVGGVSKGHSSTISDQSNPSVETSPSAKSYYSNHNNGLNRLSRDEPRYGQRNANNDDSKISQADSARDSAERNASRTDDRLPGDVKERLHAKGVNIDNSVDVDRTVTVAPAVTHEVVKPTTHHIIKEEIHREIHNHEVYHRVLPVYETEVLPARHFVPNPEGKGLIEVSEDQLPDCTGVNQRWFIGERETLPSSRKPLPQTTKPKFAGEKTYMTPEGFERKETMIIHPPELEDMSNYTGPVQEVHFHHEPLPDGVHATNKAHRSHQTQSPDQTHASYTAQASKATDALTGAHAPHGQVMYEDEVPDRAPDVKRYSMKGLAKDLPSLPAQKIPPRSSSVRN